VGAEPCGNLFDALAQEGVPVGGLGELQLGSDRLQVIAKKGRVMAIARGVDADPDAWRHGRRLGVRLRGVGVLW
jgi:hypothetical protein